MKSVNAKKVGHDLGTWLSQMILKFEYWRPTRQNKIIVFRQMKDLPDDNQGQSRSFHEARQRMDMEHHIVDTYILPYVAMITAPTKSAKSKVLEDLYMFYQGVAETELNRFNIASRGIGFSTNMRVETIMEDREAFEIQMETVCGFVEKAIGKRLIHLN